MNIIHILDDATINQIAAGEVVERPASVVKELAENAIDAGATSITVEIKNGGVDLIRVTDNGSGIEESQIRNAFLRHATSKIENAEQLTGVLSLGFRGEALASVASVAKVELLTKTPDSFYGIRYVISGGREEIFEHVGAPNGTTFFVRDLFYNTPVRRKFLKSTQAEVNLISDRMQQMILSHTNISFTYIVNGNVKLQSNGKGDIKAAIYSVYGSAFLKEMVPLCNTQNDEYKVSGFIGKPSLCKSGRNFQSFFVNGRFIKSDILTSALEDAYKPYLMLHQHPVSILLCDFPPMHLDVNVHPAKLEIKFEDEELVRKLIYDAISKTLSEISLIPSATDIYNAVQTTKGSTPSAITEVKQPEPFEVHRKEVFQNTNNDVSNEDYSELLSMAHAAITQNRALQNDSINGSVNENNVQNNELADVPIQLELSQPEFLSAEAKSKHRYIGQLFSTYILMEYNETLYIVDQHAAHEKVLYEKFMKQFRNNEITSQQVCPPTVVSLSLAEEDILRENSVYFKNFGFEIEHFGGHDYAISAVPSYLFKMTETEYFNSILEALQKGNSHNDIDTINDRIATMACKAAVKGNMNLTEQEAIVLLDDLMLLENPFNCPHGRPTIISFTQNEIEKLFKRIV